MNKDRQSLNEKKRKFADLPTAKVLAIVEKQDRDQWSEDDLAAASELLEDRRRGTAVSPPVGEGCIALGSDRDSDYSAVPASVTILRVCGFLYFAVSVVTSVIILAHHESPDINIAPFIILTLFQGVVVGTFLLVIALIGEKTTTIAAILNGDRRKADQGEYDRNERKGGS